MVRIDDRLLAPDCAPPSASARDARPRVVRAAMVAGWAKAAEQVGLDPARMIAEAGLPADVLETPDVSVPWSAVCAVVAAATRQSGREDFGLLVGDAYNISHLGLLGLLMRSQPTVRAALDMLCRYSGHQNDATSFRLEPLDGGLLVVPILTGVPPAAARAMDDLILSCMVRILGVLAPGRGPEFVCVSQPAPADQGPYRRRFGRVEFGHGFSGVCIGADQLDRPIATHEADIANFVTHLLKARGAVSTASVVDRAEALITQLLPTGGCTAPRVAQMLGVDRRTLHRRLAMEGLTFTALVDRIRRDLAAEQVRAGARQLTEVADLLGFSSLSTFSRWFHRSHGTSAREYRKAA